MVKLGLLRENFLNEQNPHCYIDSTQYFPFFYFTVLPIAQFSAAKVWLWIIRKKKQQQKKKKKQKKKTTNKQQEDHDGPISLTWANSFAYLLLKFQPSSLL